MNRIAAALLAALALAGCSSEPTVMEEIPSYDGVWAEEFADMPLDDEAETMLALEHSWTQLYPSDQYEVCGEFYYSPAMESRHVYRSMVDADVDYGEHLTREMVEDFLWKACRFQ